MSKLHDKLATIKLTDANRKAVDRRARLESKTLSFRRTRTAVANTAITVGINAMNTPNPDYTTKP